jgi:hypothetical protein
MCFSKLYLGKKSRMLKGYMAGKLALLNPLR